MIVSSPIKNGNPLSLENVERNMENEHVTMLTCDSCRFTQDELFREKDLKENLLVSSIPCVLPLSL